MAVEFVVDEVVDRGGALNLVLSTEGSLRAEGDAVG